jgi:putative ABC transport system permease protein
VIGFAVAEVLVKVQSGVFDPPPDVLSIPWPYLSGVMGAAVACTIGAVLTLKSRAERPDPCALRRS